MNTTEQLARFVVNTRIKDIPKPVIERAKVLFIDAVGAALAGVPMPLAKKLTNYYNQNNSGVKEATALGTGILMSAENAGLINGTSLHCTELEAVPRIGEQQPAFTVFAALALAEMLDLSGKDTLEAFILGYELHGRLSANAHGIPARGGWGCVTGTLGAAATAGKALKLSTDQMRMALGFASSQTGGLIENVGTTAHYMEMGIGVFHGIRSALWVKEGLTAMPDVIENPKGFSAFYAGKDGYDLNGMVRDLGKGKFYITDPGASIKKYPCCMRAHCAMDSALLLRKENGISINDIAEVEVGENFYVHSLLKYPKPVSKDQSRYSMEHCIAAILVDGKVDEDTFTIAAINRLKKYRGKIKVVMHREWHPERTHSRTPVTIRLKNGKEFTNEMDKPLDPSTEAVIERYKANARQVLSKKQAEDSADRLMNLENVKRITDLTKVVKGRRQK